MAVLYYANDNRLVVRELRDPTRPPGSRFLNEGVVVTARILREGKPVGDPIALSYEPGSNGTYAAIVSAAIDVKPGKFYVAEISVAGALGSNATFVEPLEVRQRGPST